MSRLRELSELGPKELEDLQHILRMSHLISEVEHCVKYRRFPAKKEKRLMANMKLLARNSRKSLHYLIERTKQAPAFSIICVCLFLICGGCATTRPQPLSVRRLSLPIDDQPALQLKADRASARNPLILEAGRTYNLTRPIRINKPLWIRTNKAGVQATLHCPHMAESWMALLIIEPKYGPTQTWSEKLVAGQRPKGISIAAGKSYMVGYGVNPHALGDPAENHYRGFSDDGGLPAPPRNIMGENHWCKQILSSPDATIIEDIRFTSASGVNIDFALGIEGTRGVVVRNIGLDTRMGFAVMNSRGVVIDDVCGRVNYVDGMTASGRVLTCQMSTDVSINNVDVEASDWASVFMAESWSDGISYDNIKIRLRKEKPTWPPNPIWFGNGGTRNQVVRNFAIVGDLYLFDTGGATSGWEWPRFLRGTYTGTNWREDIKVESLERVGVN